MPEPAAPQRKYDFDRVFRLLLTAAILLGLFWLVRYLAEVLIPFAVALLLAYLLNPIVSALESRLGKRLYAVLVTLAGVALTVLTLIVVLVPVVNSQVKDFRKVIAELTLVESMPPGTSVTTQAVSALRDRYQQFVESQTRPLVREALAYVPKLLQDVDPEQLAADLIRRFAPTPSGLLTSVGSLIAIAAAIIITAVYLVFLLLDYPEVARKWKSFLPPGYRDEIVRFLGEFELVMGRYFRGQFVVAAATGILLAIGFSIIGLRLGALLGLFIGVLAMIPYMQAVGLIPAILLALLKALETGGSVFWSIALVLIVFGVVQVIQDTVLTPRIMGKATGLQPAIILLGVVVWGKLLGFLGLVLAIPLTCIAIAYYRRLVLGRAATV